MPLKRHIGQHYPGVFPGNKSIVVEIVHFESHPHFGVHVTHEHLDEMVDELVLVDPARFLLVKNIVKPIINDSRQFSVLNESDFVNKHFPIFVSLSQVTLVNWLSTHLLLGLLSITLGSQ